jgi:perosamine synthetase
MKIPLAQPTLSDIERDYCSRAINSGQISGFGDFIDEMESSFTQYIGRTFCAAVSNGTAALHLALLALNIGPKDEVIIPNFGYVAFANAVRYVGATPILVDIEPLGWGIDPLEMEKRITKKTKAVILVHNYGLQGQISTILKMCKEKQLLIIEDAAEALGGSYEGKLFGSFGDISTFSFYGNKILTSGEGGAILTDDSKLIQRIKLLRGQGMDPKNRYWFPEVGYNYRLSNIQASIFCAQFRQLEGFLKKRREIFGRYHDIVSKVGDDIFFGKNNFAPWLFTFLLNSNINREDFAKFLETNGIETRPTFVEISRLPAFAMLPIKKKSVSLDVARRGISLPTFVDLSEDQLQIIADSIRNFTIGE